MPYTTVTNFIKIAEAVAAVINAHESSPGFTITDAVSAVLSLNPKADLEDTADLQVIVTPISEQQEPANRGQVAYDYTVQVAIHKKVSGFTVDEIDPLVQLAGQIVALFRWGPLTGYAKAQCFAAKLDPILSRENLDQLRLFSAFAVLNFRVIE